MSDRSIVERVWWGTGPGATAARSALVPLEWLYRAGVSGRAVLYDSGLLRSVGCRIPCISVGNLSVGGTGKTPVAAWLVRQALDRGASPAVVLRGYGADEPAVHRLLNPAAPVIVGADRAAGCEQASALGSDLAILDDAFQHRRVRRDADVVLISAERWGANRRLLPAGPLREPISALERASIVLITRKRASRAEAASVATSIRSRVGSARLALAHLALDDLREVGGEGRQSLGDLGGRKVLAIAGIGDPDAFFAQLAALGAMVDGARFPDHHPFDEGDVHALTRRARDATLVVCTLKDAVKLGSLWPRAECPLWYVSQRVDVEEGAEGLSQLIEAVLSGRPPDTSPSAG